MNIEQQTPTLDVCRVEHCLRLQLTLRIHVPMAESIPRPRSSLGLAKTVPAVGVSDHNSSVSPSVLRNTKVNN